MTVDYVPQMLEIQRELISKAEATKLMWQDEVANRFYHDYIDKYNEYINNYLQGGNFGNRGMGIEDLLQFFEQKAEEMSILSGCPNPIGMSGGEDVHDENLNRNMAGFDENVPNPDYLDDATVHSIESERSENDRANTMESPYSSFGRD